MASTISNCTVTVTITITITNIQSPTLLLLRSSFVARYMQLLYSLGLSSSVAFIEASQSRTITYWRGDGDGDGDGHRVDLNYRYA